MAYFTFIFIGIYVIIGIYHLFKLYSLVQIFKSDKRKLSPHDYQPNIGISLIIPFRNEEENLPRLIESLRKLDYPKNLLEVIFIDDHSTDKGSEIIQSSGYQLLKSMEHNQGKKAAQYTGILATKHELIVCTDADCIFPSDWLRELSYVYQKENPDFMAGKIEFLETHTCLEKFQMVDNSVTMMMTGSGIISKKFYLANGANMAFKKSVYLEICNSLETNFASGDDVFLVNSIANLPNSHIVFLHTPNFTIKTKSINSFKSFFKQRKRWASKAMASNSSSLTFFQSMAVLSSLMLMSALFVNVGAAILVFVLFILRSMMEFFMLKKYKIIDSINTSTYLCLSFWYQFYILFMAYHAIFPTKYDWKSRKTR